MANSRGLLGVDEAVVVGDIPDFNGNAPLAAHIGCHIFG